MGGASKRVEFCQLPRGELKTLRMARNILRLATTFGVEYYCEYVTEGKEDLEIVS